MIGVRSSLTLSELVSVGNALFPPNQFDRAYMQDGNLKDAIRV
jgi:hypothetical protein